MTKRCNMQIMQMFNVKLKQELLENCLKCKQLQKKYWYMNKNLKVRKGKLVKTANKKIESFVFS